MAERKDEERKDVNAQDGSEKIRPEDEKDFAGIERAKKSGPQNDGPNEVGPNEWEAREDESPSP